MPTSQEYAQLSNAVYNRTQKNRTPIPDGWIKERDWIVDLPNGFSAGVYKKGNDIVIAYTGTNERRIADFAFGNIPAFLGGDNYSAQVWEAMKLYLEVKRTNSATANITFTGHSLGGGLAAMMGIFFNHEARVFDAAPFEQGAISNYALLSYQANMAQFGYTNTEFDAYLSAITLQYTAREGNVFGRYLQGEALNYLRNTLTAIGLNLPVETGPTTAGALDLHSMTLLASMERSTEFADAVRKSPHLLTQIFDSNLYYRDPEISQEPNFIDRLYIAQVSNAATPLLDRFGTDVKQLTIAGGTTAQQDMQKALDVAALDYYYYKDPASATGLFTTSSGAVNFNLAEVGVAVGSLKSPSKLVDALATVAGRDSDAVRSAAASITSWHVQSGTDAMTWAGSDGLADVAVGGTAGDTLNGGGGGDLLVSLGGADSLIGAAGNDTLVGGVGNDTLDGGAEADLYVVAAHSNTDTITSSEAADILKLDGRQLNGDGTLISDSANLKLWMDFTHLGSAITYRYEVPTQKLTVAGAGSVVVINDFVDGDVGIFIPKKPKTKSDPATNTNFRSALPAPVRRDPLAIDLNGNGIETTGIGTTLILFDHNADGIRTGTGWVKANDAWLVLDRNGNGLVDSGRELFGVDTLLSGTPGIDAVYASTGFQALATLNSNGDGLFNASDGAFNQVQLWQDLNQDGISQSTELFTLAQKNISSISLTPTASNVNLGNGNTVTAQATVTRTNNTTTQIDSVAVGADTTAGNLNLASNPFYRNFPVQPLTATALTLPDMAGSGVVRDLREAMSLGNAAAAALVSAVQVFAQGTTRDAQLASLDALLRTWAATEAIADRFGIPTVGAETRRFVVTGSTDTALQAKLARIIPVLEVFNGVTVDESGWTSTASPENGVQIRTYTMAAQQAASMQASYDSLSTSVYLSLVAQTRLKPYLAGIELVVDASGARFDTTKLAAALDATKAASERNGILDLAELIRNEGSTLAAVGFDSTAKLNSWVSALPASSPIRLDLIALNVHTGATTAGTERNDIYLGTAAAESFSGNGGNDLVDGAPGNDSLAGGDGNDTLYGRDGNDTLDGGTGNDTLDGGSGDDYLNGSAGNDTYLFGNGSGRDTIGALDRTVGKVDAVQLGADVLTNDVRLAREGDALVLYLNGSPDALRVLSYFYNDATYGYQVEQIKFADGTVWDIAAVKSRVLISTPRSDTLTGYATNDTINAGDGNDTVYGQAGNDMLDGGAGADNIEGGFGDDTIRGGIGNDTLSGSGNNDNLGGDEGNDTLSGNDGNDTLDGGGGRDFLSGGAGADAYLFGIGSGKDTVNNYDYDAVGTNVDTVLLGTGIVTTGVTLKRAADDLIISLNDSAETVRVTSHFQNDVTSGNQIEQIKFADGTLWDSAIIKATVLISTPGDDRLTGYATNDTISAGDGNDSVSGHAGADVLDGGAEADFLQGDDGNDTLLGGGGNDYLHGDNDNDYLLGGTGTDTLYGDAGDDYLQGNEHNDTVYGDTGNDTLDGGSGNDSLLGGSGADVYMFGMGSGQDTVQNFDSDAVGTNVDTILLGAGIVNSGVTLTRSNDDLIIRLNGSTGTLLVSSHFRSDVFGYGVDQIKFADGAVWDAATIKTAALISTSGDDSLTGYSTNDNINAGDGDDYIYGQAGDDLLIGGAGADRLQGDDGNDTIQGGTGNDTLYGFRGNDHLQGDDGNDSLSGGAGDNTLEGGSGNDYLRGDDGSDTGQGGTGHDTLYGGTGNDSLQGNEHNDSMYGDAGNDTLDGGSGNDYLSGGTGADVYVFGRGSGQDTIYNYDTDAVGTNADTVLLGAGIATSSIRLTRSNDDLIVGVNGGDDSLLVYGYFTSNGAASSALENLKFTDGTVWNYATVTANLSPVTTPPAAPLGTLANDSLVGGPGNDLLDGLAGNDTLNGGGGNDHLFGGSGADVYLFGKGSGQDVVDNYDYDVIGTNVDTVLLGTGIVTTSVRLTRSSDDLIISLNDSADTLRVSFYFQNDATSARQVEQIKFADGTVWDATNVKTRVLLSTLGDDSLTGYAINDNINAGDGNDYLSGHAGEDSLNGSAGADYLQGDEGNDIIQGGTGNDTLYGGIGNDSLQGNDHNDSLNGGDGNDHLQGNEHNDTLYGDAGNDTLDGGSGNDYLSGGAGADVYLFGRGSGQDTISNDDADAIGTNADVVLLGAGVSNIDLQLTREVNSLMLSISGSPDTLRIGGYFQNDATSSYLVEQIKFADGTVWDVSTVKAKVLTATSGDDTLYGYDTSNDSINAGDGNDYVYGNGGDDVLNGGTGADYVQAGVGNDTVQGGTGYDNLFGEAGNDNLQGNEHNDSLYGGAGNDTLDGGSGNDSLWGGIDTDVYLFGRGSGQDTINNYYEYAVGPNADSILLGAGIATSGVTLKRTSDSLIISLNGSDDSLTVFNYFYKDATYGYQVEQIRFADGTAWDVATVKAKVLIATSDDDMLYGYDATNDTINAGDGNDYVSGKEGDDVLDGGYGNDSLDGGGGNNIYRFGKDDGQDLITVRSYATGDKLNSLQFKAGILPSDVALTRAYDPVLGSYGALEASIADTNDKITINGFSYNDNANYGTNPVQQIKFADGTTWDTTSIQALMSTNNIGGTSTAESLTGSALGDQLFGLDGNDTLSGGAGHDWLDGGAGNDLLIGGTGNDVYVVDSALDAITELPNEGTDTVRSSTTASLLTLGAALENLVLTGTGAINGTGNMVANRLFGNSAANRLDGGTGADVLNGGAGNDTYIVDNGSDVIVEFAGEGTDTVEASIPWTLGNEIENLLLTGTSALAGTGNTLNNSLTGNAANNTLTGGGGNDTLSGGAGADTLIGGVGNDAYVVDVATDVVTELAGEGTDTVQSAVTWTLGDTLENLTLTGSAAINGTGNALNNVLNGNAARNTLTGNAGNDTLNGGAGADTMIGGAGNDVYVVDAATDVVTELAGEGADTVQTSATWTLGEFVENLTMIGAAAINGTGNALNNHLIGNSANNTLTGGAGNDTLNGGSGADTLIGGTGNDLYVVDAVTDVVIEAANEGTDSVQSAVTWTLGADVEHLTLTGSSATHATGNSLDNSLSGNSANNTLTGDAGNDTLNGGTGIDTMIGGTGNDFYVVDVATDVVTELVGEGTDTIQSAVTWTLSNTFENLTLTGSTAINGTGNELDNVLIGNYANNVLTGGAGNDTLSGGASADTMVGGLGNDTYTVDIVHDVIWEAANEGVDTVQSAVSWTLGANLENLVLTGSSAINATGNTLNNMLTGNSGANVLAGGTGNDTYTGGLGSDTLNDTSTTSSDIYVWGRTQGTDIVTDAGGTDRLDLLAGVTEDQIWLRQVDNNLELSVIGTTDRLTINGWYTSPSHQIESFRLVDGQALLASQVQQLVDAMAAFAPPAAGQTTLPANYAAALNPVIAPSWA